MDLITPQLRTELELDRPPSSVWERLFRWGVFYLFVTTVIGTIAEAVFGEAKSPMPPWGWILVGPYLFFMLYCSNYVVARFVKSKLVKVAWWCLIGFIALVLTMVGVERLTKANQTLEPTRPSLDVSYDP